MKKLIFLCLFSSHLLAADLIFKSGFQNTALVSGLATGVSSSGLSLQLTVNSSTETLSIDSNGRFVFETDVTIGDNWSVSTLSLPNNPQQQNCVVINTNGTMPANGANTLQVTCDNTLWNWNQMNWNEGGWQ